MPIAAVTFDLWFTLIYSDSELERYYYNSRIRALQDAVGIAYSQASMLTRKVDERIAGMGKKQHDVRPGEMARMLLEEVGLKGDRGLELAERLGEALSDAGLERSPQLNHESMPILSKLHFMGLRLGLITNVRRSLRSYEKILGRLEILGYFDTLVLSSELAMGKPKREVFAKALKELRVKPHEAVHVGDSYEDDILGARSAGMHSILYIGLWEAYSKARGVVRTHPASEDGVMIAKSLTEVPQLINMIGNGPRIAR